MQMKKKEKKRKAQDNLSKSVKQRRVEIGAEDVQPGSVRCTKMVDSSQTEKAHKDSAHNSTPRAKSASSKQSKTAASKPAQHNVNHKPGNAQHNVNHKPGHTQHNVNHKPGHTQHNVNHKTGKHRPRTLNVKTKKTTKMDRGPPKKAATPAMVVELPRTADEMSSNWKQLQQMLKLTDTTRSKRRPAPKVKSPPVSKVTTSQPEIWFDDVDDILIDTLKTSVEGATQADANPLIKRGQFTGITKVVAMDCEMVGVGNGQESILARVSIVNHDGHPIYDKFVKPREKVTDYRTFVSGVRPEDLENAHEFENVQKEVADILKDRILVGHALHNDIKVLFLSHPRKDTRDTAKFKPFRRLVGGRTPGLKKLAKELLGVEVQSGEHSSVQDAQAAMRIYTMHRKEWEKHLKETRHIKSRKKRQTTTQSTTDS